MECVSVQFPTERRENSFEARDVSEIATKPLVFFFELLFYFLRWLSKVGENNLKGSCERCAPRVRGHGLIQVEHNEEEQGGNECRTSFHLFLHTAFRFVPPCSRP